MNYGNDSSVAARFRDYDPDMLRFLPAPDTTEEYRRVKSVLADRSLGRLKKLEAIHRYADVFLSSYQSQAVCQLGCAHCCKIPVLIHEIEAQYIARKTGRLIDRNSDNPAYCPLLDQSNGQCTAYNYRPLACRAHFAFDHPRYCEVGHEIHAITSIESSRRLLEFKFAIYDLSGNDAEKDIRQFFKAKTPLR